MITICFNSKLTISLSALFLLSSCNPMHQCLKTEECAKLCEHKPDDCKPCPPCPPCPEPQAPLKAIAPKKQIKTRLVSQEEICSLLKLPKDQKDPTSPAKNPTNNIDAAKKAARASLEIISDNANELYFQNAKYFIGKKGLADSINTFLEILDTSTDSTYCKAIFENFDVLEISGQNSDDALVTGYYQPEIEASLSRNETFKHPLLSTPADLVNVNLKNFDSSLPNITLYGQIKDNRLVPYLTRQEIETKMPSELSILPIAWLKSPVDALILHIQGSGILKLPGGRQKFIHYAANNGRAYGSIGSWLIANGYLQKDKASWQDIEALAQRQPDVFQNSLQANQRYIFFEWRENGPLGAYGELLHDRLSVALDPEIYPPGAVLLLKTTLPSETEQIHTIFNHDKGAAIQGGMRIDFYTGTGKKAGELAGKMKNKGKIFALLPKQHD